MRALFLSVMSFVLMVGGAVLSVRLFQAWGAPKWLCACVGLPLGFILGTGIVVLVCKVLMYYEYKE